MAQSVICCLIGLKRVWQFNLIETLPPRLSRVQLITFEI